MNILILPRTPCQPSDPLSYLFFVSLDTLYRYRPDPLPDFRRTRGGWGDSPIPTPARAHLCLLLQFFAPLFWSAGGLPPGEFWGCSGVNPNRPPT